MNERERGTDWMVGVGEPMFYVGLIVSAIKLLGGGDPKSPTNWLSIEVAGPITGVVGSILWLLGTRARIEIGRYIFGDN